MGANGITRRDALKMGGLAFAGAAGSAILGGCASGASTSSSMGSSSGVAGSTAGDRTGAPSDATGSDIESLTPRESGWGG